VTCVLKHGALTGQAITLHCPHVLAASVLRRTCDLRHPVHDVVGCFTTPTHRLVIEMTTVRNLRITMQLFRAWVSRPTLLIRIAVGSAVAAKTSKDCCAGTLLKQRSMKTATDEGWL